MIESLVNPVCFAVFLLAAVFMRWCRHHESRRILRPVLLLAFNLAVLGLFLGNWKGLGFYIAYATVVGWWLRNLTRGGSGARWRCAALVTSLVAVLALAKYILPGHPKGNLAVQYIYGKPSIFHS